MAAEIAEAEQRPKNYFSFHFRLFRFLGLGWWHNPDEGDTDNFTLYYIPYCIITQLVWVIGFVGLETVDPFIGEKKGERFMFNLAFVITHNLTVMKLYILILNNRHIQDVASTLEVDMYAYYQNYDKNHAAMKNVRLLTRSYLFFGWATIANTNINGIIQDLRWKSSTSLLAQNASAPERTFAQPVYIPWNFQQEKAYIATFILEACGLLWTGHIVIVIDTFIGAVILHLSSQFRTLQEAFASLYERAMLDLHHGLLDDDQLGTDREDVDAMEDTVRAYYSQEQIEETLEKILNSCIRQHQVLISCCEKFARTYSYGFLCQLLSSMGAICVIMVQVSVDASSFKSVSFASSLAFFMAMIMQLAMQCITGNYLTLQTSGVADAAWRCGWERLPARLRRRLVLVIARAQRPLRLSAGGFAVMDNGCFLSILKAAYSYYAVISQKRTNES